MATGPQKAKGMRWLYIAVALIVVLGLAYWLTSYNAGTDTGDAAAPTPAPVSATTN